MIQLDTSYAEARPVILRSHDAVALVLIGVGGTGSYLGPLLAVLARLIMDTGRQVTLTFIDHDLVEEKNLPRQNFCDAELGLNKAVTMAARCGAAKGLRIDAIPRRFDAYSFPFYGDGNRLTVIASAVDNAAARQAIAQVLTRNEYERAPRIWWIDAGNHRSGGQVILGSAATVEGMRGAFTFKNRCLALPSPALQEPDLLVPRPEEANPQGMACAELMRANMQAATINPAMAVIVYNYLHQLLVEGDLRLFASAVALNAGVWNSKYTTPAALGKVLGVEPDFFDAAAAERS